MIDQLFEIVTRRTFFLTTRGLGAALLLSADAFAEEPLEVFVNARHVYVRDVAPDCSGSVCDLVLGRAPPAGSSTILTRERVLRQVAAKALRSKAVGKIPQKVRVRSRARILSTKEWGELAGEQVRARLPKGVRLLSSEGKIPLTLPENYELGAVSLPRLPRRSGPWATTAMVEILHEKSLLRKAPVVVRLEVEPGAVRPTIKRGQGLTLVLARRSATISMRGVSLRDGEVGSVVACRVSKTGRVVKARLRSGNLADVVESK